MYLVLKNFPIIEGSWNVLAVVKIDILRIVVHILVLKNTTRTSVHRDVSSQTKMTIF